MTYKLDRFDIREKIAESGKVTVREMMAHLNHFYPGEFDKTVAKEEAKEIAAQIKKYC
jgi:hypothetical protein